MMRTLGGNADICAFCCTKCDPKKMSACDKCQPQYCTGCIDTHTCGCVAVLQFSVVSCYAHNLLILRLYLGLRDRESCGDDHMPLTWGYMRALHPSLYGPPK